MKRTARTRLFDVPFVSFLFGVSYDLRQDEKQDASLAHRLDADPLFEPIHILLQIIH